MNISSIKSIVIHKNLCVYSRILCFSSLHQNCLFLTRTPSLEIFRCCLDTWHVLGNILQGTLLEQKGWTRWSAEVPSNVNHSVIFWYTATGTYGWRGLMKYLALKLCAEILWQRNSGERGGRRIQRKKVLAVIFWWQKYLQDNAHPKWGYNCCFRTLAEKSGFKLKQDKRKTSVKQRKTKTNKQTNKNPKVFSWYMNRLYLQHYPVLVFLSIHPCNLQSTGEEVKVLSKHCHLVTTEYNCRNAHVFPGTSFSSQGRTFSEGKHSFYQLLIELQRSACIYIHCITIKVDFWKWTWGQVNTVPVATENAKLHMQYTKRNLNSYSFLVDCGFQSFPRADSCKNDEWVVWRPYLPLLSIEI